MATELFQKLVIDGVGLLGGSMGLAVRRRGLACVVAGLGRSAERLERARLMGAIDEAHTDPAAALAGADALVLAVPPRRIRERLAELAPRIGPGVFVTDVGSVKAGIVAAGERELNPEALFIGSHPMAGSEKSGVEFARENLYEASACILTPTPRTRPEALQTARRLWEALGTRVVEIDPERHDRLLAGISHLPHLVAAALMAALSRALATPEEMSGIAGGGLRDTTRIAASDPELWKDIFSENAPAVRDILDALLAVLGEWRAALDTPAPDMELLGRLFAEGRTARERMKFE